MTYQYPNQNISSHPHLNNTYNSIRTQNSDFNPMDERFSVHSSLQLGSVANFNSKNNLNQSQRPYTFDEMNSLIQKANLDYHMTDLKSKTPDLSEVINFLRHHDDSFKINAAAYLQHLSYMDDNVKVQIRVLRGIPALVEMINNSLLEVQRVACGVLRNLSYGRANDENKKEIKDNQGISALVRLLKRTTDQDIEELVTGVLWNLSSCSGIKSTIINEALKALVEKVIIPYSGWRMDLPNDIENQNYKLPSFRNASGIMRNISSDGDYARKVMRECSGLIESLIQVIKICEHKQDFDGKSLENCVCTLRNLSYACQEIVDPNYLNRRNNLDENESKSKSGCFKLGKSSGSNNNKNQFKNDRIMIELKDKGMCMLWSNEVVNLYIKILKYSSNPETIEAAIGAIQNLTACDWMPSAEIRTAVRLARVGLQIIIELLSETSDRIICSAATALRNLCVDEKNKELIGKYATLPLTDKLHSSSSKDLPLLSNDSIAAVLSALYEVIRSNVSFARSFVGRSGAEKLYGIVQSPSNLYNTKIYNYSQKIIQRLWKYDELHDEMKSRGLNPNDLQSQGKSQTSSVNNTLQHLLPDKSNQFSSNAYHQSFNQNQSNNNLSFINKNKQPYPPNPSNITITDYSNQPNFDPYYGHNSTIGDRHENINASRQPVGDDMLLDEINNHLTEDLGTQTNHSQNTYIPGSSFGHQLNLNNDERNRLSMYSTQRHNLNIADNSWV